MTNTRATNCWRRKPRVFASCYELTIASAGTTHYTEAVRKGAEVSDVSAIDLDDGRVAGRQAGSRSDRRVFLAVP